MDVIVIYIDTFHMPSDFFSEFKEIFHSGHCTSSFTHSRIMFIEFLSSPFASHHLCPVRLRKDEIISIFQQISMSSFLIASDLGPIKIYTYIIATCYQNDSIIKRFNILIYPIIVINLHVLETEYFSILYNQRLGNLMPLG